VTDSDNKINEDRDPRRAANEPPDRGRPVAPDAPVDGYESLARKPNETPASQGGRYPTRDLPPRAQRDRRRS
jgi:hypothetical protein